MKAVDFACRFLLNTLRSPLSPTECKVILAVAAGVPNAAGIAKRMDMRACVCTLTLRAMEHRRLVRRDSYGFYSLAPAGERLVEQLLSVHPGS